MDLFKKKLNTVSSKEDNFINPKVLEVNLIKDEVIVDFNWKKHLISLFLTLIVAASFVAEIYYGLSWWQQQEEEKTAAINLELQGVTGQIKKINNNAKDFTSFKDKLTLTKQMADTHIYWTDFFNWLEKNTLNSVVYSGFSGDITGDYNLSATAKNFSDISWQVKAFKNDKFTDFVEVSSGSSGRNELSTNSDNKVSFSLRLKVKPQIFYRQAE